MGLYVLLSIELCYKVRASFIEIRTLNPSLNSDNRLSLMESAVSVGSDP